LSVKSSNIKGARAAIIIPFFRQNVYTTPNAAVQNTWYTVADLRNVTVLGAHFACTVANETLEVETVIDGATFVQVQIAVFNTDYSNGLNSDYTGLYANAVRPYYDGQLNIMAKSVRIRIRKTTAGGASFLRHQLTYQQW
jgi:hypothetical protein